MLVVIVKFIYPLSDIGFNRISGNKLFILNILIPLLVNSFKDSEYLDKEQKALSGDVGSVIYDLFCQNLVLKGMSSEEVSELTGLPFEEIVFL